MKVINDNESKIESKDVTLHDKHSGNYKIVVKVMETDCILGAVYYIQEVENFLQGMKSKNIIVSTVYIIERYCNLKVFNFETKLEIIIYIFQDIESEITVYSSGIDSNINCCCNVGN